MPQPPTHKVNFDGHIFTVTPLTPDMFLSDTEGVPVCPFICNEQKIKTMFEQTMGDVPDNADGPSEAEVKSIVDRFKLILRKSVIEMDGIPFVCDSIFKNEGDELLDAFTGLFNYVIDISFQRFKGITKMSMETVCAVDFMAKRYGKTPIECFMIPGEYNALDAYTFNYFILGMALKNEKKQTEQAQSQMARSTQSMRGA